MTKHFFILIIICICLPVVLKAQKWAAYDKGNFIGKTDTLAYRILFPKNFDPSQKYPLIIVLHGSGERGSDNESQLNHGGDLFLRDTIRNKYPAFVLFPQCPNNQFWSDVKIETDTATKHLKFYFPLDAPPTRAMQALLDLTKDFLDKPYINQQQVYVGGLSMGGMGAFEIIGRKPKYFAAAFAICGGDNGLNAKKYAKKVPMWIFHGAKDNVVSPDHSQIMVDAIRAEGGDPKFTLYPNDGHDSWDDAFAEPTFMQWLFSHSK